MADERVWLRHAETGGAFHCPVAAAEDWAEMGWAPGEPPEEINPAIADRLAQEREQAAAQEAAEKQAAKTKRAGKPADTEEK